MMRYSKAMMPNGLVSIPAARFPWMISSKERVEPQAGQGMPVVFLKRQNP